MRIPGMLAGIAALCLLAPPKPLNILFLGNSHTGNNDVPALVKSLLESDDSKRAVRTKSYFAAFLNDFSTRQEVIADLKSGQWNIVVLQGAKVSSSHKYTYSQAGGIEIAKLAAKAKARVLLFVEWPRRGWDESEYQLDVYRGIARETGAEIVPVCYAWDVALKAKPTLDLWLADGNHSNPTGGYLAACVFYYYLQPNSEPSWQPPSMPNDMAKFLRQSAKRAIKIKRQII